MLTFLRYLLFITFSNVLQLFAEASQLRHRRIVSGGLHHAALLVHGDLYTWGATKNGKLAFFLCLLAIKASDMCVVSQA